MPAQNKPLPESITKIINSLEQQSQIIKEKLFESLHQNITFCYLLSFLYQAIDAYYECDIPVDLDINNILLIRDSASNIKFVFVPKFKHFADYLDRFASQILKINNAPSLEKEYAKIKKAYIIEAMTFGIPKFFQDLALLLVDYKSIAENKTDAEEKDLITMVTQCTYIPLFKYADNPIMMKRALVENIKKQLLLNIIQQNSGLRKAVPDLLVKEKHFMLDPTNKFKSELLR